MNAKDLGASFTAALDDSEDLELEHQLEEGEWQQEDETVVQVLVDANARRKTLHEQKAALGGIGNNIFPAHTGAVSFASECQKQIFEPAGEHPDDFEEESVVSKGAGKSGWVSRRWASSHDGTSQRPQSDIITNNTALSTSTKAASPTDATSATLTLNDNVNAKLILPSPSLELVENNYESNSSEVSLAQFSYVSNDTNSSDLDVEEDELVTPRNQKNVTLGTDSFSSREKEKDNEEDVTAGGKDEGEDGNDSVANKQPLGLKIDLTDMMPSLFDTPASKEDEAPSQQQKNKQELEQGKKAPPPRVQYSDKQTERIRAKESQIRLQHRQQRKKARLGLQAQERLSDSGNLWRTLLPVESSTTDDTLSDLPLLPASGITSTSSRHTPNSSSSRTHGLKPHSQWRTGKTRRKPVYDGVPDSPPGGAASLSLVRSGRQGDEQNSAESSTCWTGPGGIEDEDEEDDYPDLQMDWNH